MREIITREKAGLKPPLKMPRFDPDKIKGISFHDQGLANLNKKWLTRKYYWARSMQQVHFGRGWSDIAYSFVIARSGAIVEAKGFRWRAFAEGPVEHNKPYDWNFPEFLEGEKWGNDHFVSVCFATVGAASQDVKPYDFNGERIYAVKGEQVPPSPAQLEAADWLVNHIRLELGKPLEVWGHGGHRKKICPGPHIWPHIQRGRWAVKPNIPNPGVVTPPAPPQPVIQSESEAEPQKAKLEGQLSYIIPSLQKVVSELQKISSGLSQ